MENLLTFLCLIYLPTDTRLFSLIFASYMYNIFKYRPQSHSEASEKHMRIAEKNIKNNRPAICELQHRDMRRDNMRFACFFRF